MPYNVDVSFDPVHETLRLLVHHGLRERLDGVVGAGVSAHEPALVRTHNHPIPSELANVDQTPMATVYPRRDAVEVRSSKHRLDAVTVFRIEYVLPPTPLENLDVRWPILRRVWRELAHLLCAGRTPSLEANAAVLELAGVTELDLTDATVTYEPYVGGGQVYPALAADITVRSRDLPGEETRPLLELFARYRLQDLPEAEQPFVETLTSA